MVTDGQLAELERWIMTVGWDLVLRFAKGVGGICEPGQLHLLTSCEAGAVLMGLHVFVGGGHDVSLSPAVQVTDAA